MDQNNNAAMKVGKTTCACGEGCNCGCGYRPGYHLLRWALGIFILFFVFAIGVKLGEFLTELRYDFANSNNQYHMMMQMHDDSGYYSSAGQGMAPMQMAATSSDNMGQ